MGMHLFFQNNFNMKDILLRPQTPYLLYLAYICLILFVLFFIRIFNNVNRGLLGAFMFSFLSAGFFAQYYTEKESCENKLSNDVEALEMAYLYPTYVTKEENIVIIDVFDGDKRYEAQLTEEEYEKVKVFLNELAFQEDYIF